MNVYIDIETIPTQSEEHRAWIRADLEAERDKTLAGVRAPANYKDPAKIDEYIAQARQQIVDQHEAAVQAAIERTSLDGALGQIACVAWATDHGDTTCLSVSDLSLQSEASLLELLWTDLQALHTTSGTRPVIIGHNHIAFDLPFLWQRSVIHGVRPPMWWPRNPKPWSDHVIDTMLMWAGDRSRISMDRLCRVLGMPGKGDFTGADVWPAVREGRLKEVAEYCRQDVERTRAMHRRLTFAEAA